VQIRAWEAFLKKFLWLLPLVVAVAVYGTGAWKLSASGANQFLNELEALSLQEKSDAYCALLHEDLTVSIRDHTSPQLPRDFDGGKAEFCAFVSYAALGTSLIGPESQVTRHDFTVTRSWLHPWTAQVSYHETRTTRMTLVNATLNTVGDDKWILVYTFGGVKVLRLESVSELAD
jgi:hypothetical protein